MKTWLNVFGGVMILWPLFFCLYGAGKENGLLEGLKCASVIGLTWLVCFVYTALAIWLVMQ